METKGIPLPTTDFVERKIKEIDSKKRFVLKDDDIDKVWSFTKIRHYCFTTYWKFVADYSWEEKISEKPSQLRFDEKQINERKGSDELSSCSLWYW